MRNRRQPDDGVLHGEIIPPGVGTDVVRDSHVPGMVTLGELGGTLNVVGRIRAWGQAKGFAAASEMLTQFEGSLRAKQRVVAALEDLAIQQDRLSGDNFAVLLETSRLQIDTRLVDVENQLQGERARGRQAQLKAEIDEVRLERLLLTERQKLDEALGNGDPKTEPPEPEQEPEPSLEEQTTILTARLAEKQDQLNDTENLTSAKELLLHQEISMLIVELEALRLKHAQSV